jgi:hypothetical protein
MSPKKLFYALIPVHVVGLQIYIVILKHYQKDFEFTKLKLFEKTAAEKSLNTENSTNLLHNVQKQQTVRIFYPLRNGA